MDATPITSCATRRGICAWVALPAHWVGSWSKYRPNLAHVGRSCRHRSPACLVAATTPPRYFHRPESHLRLDIRQSLGTVGSVGWQGGCALDHPDIERQGVVLVSGPLLAPVAERLRDARAPAARSPGCWGSSQLSLAHQRPHRWAGAVGRDRRHRPDRPCLGLRGPRGAPRTRLWVRPVSRAQQLRGCAGCSSRRRRSVVRSQPGRPRGRVRQFPTPVSVPHAGDAGDTVDRVAARHGLGCRTHEASCCHRADRAVGVPCLRCQGLHAPGARLRHHRGGHRAVAYPTSAYCVDFAGGPHLRDTHCHVSPLRRWWWRK